MANVRNYYVVYSDDAGVVGLFTAKKAAEEHATSVEGSVLHMVPVALLNQPLTATEYTPPSPPVLQYGPADGFAAEEMPELDPQRIAEPEDYYNEAVSDQSGYQAPVAQVTAPPKALSPKDLILAKLARELDVEDENHDEDFIPEPDPQPVRGGFQPQPQGGFTQTNPTGVGGHGVEYFSPLG